MGWIRRAWVHVKWKRIQGAAIINEASMEIHRMTVWGQLPAGTWLVKRPLTVAAGGPVLYLTFRVCNEVKTIANASL